MQPVAVLARFRASAPLTVAATSKALRAGGVAGAEEPDAEHGAASKGPVAGVEERVAGAVEPSGRPPLSDALAAIQTQVPTSAERDRVLDAGRRVSSAPNRKVVRPLAGNWGAPHKVGGPTESRLSY